MAVPVHAPTTLCVQAASNHRMHHRMNRVDEWLTIVADVEQVGVVRREGGDFMHFDWAPLEHFESGADYAPLQFDERARGRIAAVPEGPVDRNIQWVEWQDPFPAGGPLLGPPPPAEAMVKAAREGSPWVADLAKRIGWIGDGTGTARL